MTINDREIAAGIAPDASLFVQNSQVGVIRQPIMIMRVDNTNGDIVVTATKEQIVEDMKYFGREYHLMALLALRIEELERKLADKDLV